MSFGEFKNQVGIQQKNVTLSNIIKLYEDIADANEYIQDATFGDIFEIDLKETNYALSHLSIESARFTNHELSYSLSLYVMDLVSTDEGNENDVLSDTLQVIGDFISQFKHSTSFGDMENDFRFSDDVACTPFTERFDNDVTGWRADLEVVVSFNASACTTDTM
tara:strand:- start:9024 stop:9515 length:492 start_codon:yes stop_codon:yes gene_type:complete